MKKPLRAIVAVSLLASWLATPSAPAPTGSNKSDVFLATIEGELKRAQSELSKADPAPYYLSYTIRDLNSAAAVGILGDLASSLHTRRRTADVITRIGSPALDNSHQESRRSAIHSGTLPLDDDGD